MFSFWFGKIVAVLVLPPTGPVLLILAGLLLMRRWRRFGRGLALAATIALLVLSLPVVGALLMAAVADAPALRPGTKVDAQAIAVLGCGIRPDAGEYGGDTLSAMSLERVRYAAFLAQHYGLPVALTGGAVGGHRTEGEVMREVLAKEYGIEASWVDTEALDTHQNAVRLRELLAPSGVRKLLVVTHGVDTRRARRELQAAGFGVTMAPTFVPGFTPDSVWDFIPSLSGLRGSHIGLYEILANARATWNGIP